MILSRDYTWISSSRIALLPENIIQKLWEKYPYRSWQGGKQKNTINIIKKINNLFALDLHGKEDLVTEWALQSMSQGSGEYLWGMHTFVNTALFYFRHSKEPRFKDAVQRVAEERGVGLNSKNILTFNLDDLYAVKREYDNPTEPELTLDPTVLPDPLPDGAWLFYQGGGYQILEVTTTTTACALSRDTQWCTKRPGAALAYLEDAPLYVIYKDGRRIAQLHIGKSSGYQGGVQLMDLDNIPIEQADEGMKEALIQAGLMDKILAKVMGNPDYSAEIAYWKWIDESENPYFREKCAKDPEWAYLYAMRALHESRFPEGEPAIASDPHMAWGYVRDIIKKRWPEGEPAIMSVVTLKQYYWAMVRSMDPVGWKHFQKIFEKDREDQFREMIEEV